MVSQQEQSITNLPPLLEVFTKASNDMQWSFMPMPVVKRRKESTSSRPLSSYGLGADVLGGSKMGWSHGTGARRSVLVSGTGGHFLELPTADTPARGDAAVVSPASPLLPAVAVRSSVFLVSALTRMKWKNGPDPRRVMEKERKRNWICGDKSPRKRKPS